MAVDRAGLYRRPNRLGQLRAFCHAARLESFAGAAEHLDLDPQMVSLHVRELERELETSLFARSGPRISLTASGRRFYTMAQPLVAGMEGLRESFTERITDTSTGKVAIGVGPAAANFVLPRCLKRIQDEHPGLLISVTIDMQQALLEHLRNGAVEVVLAAENSDEQGLAYRPLFQYEIVLIAPEDHALAGREEISVEELSEWPAVAPDFGSSGRPLTRVVDLWGTLQPDSIGNEGGWDEIKHFVEAGLGIALFPSFGVSDRDRVAAIPIRPSARMPGYGLFTRLRTPPSAAAKQVLRMIDSQLSSPAGVSPR